MFSGVGLLSLVGQIAVYVGLFQWGGGAQGKVFVCIFSLSHARTHTHKATKANLI